MHTVSLFRHRPELSRVNREQGLTMFEILITIVVVSIGLLGLAGLQFTGLRAANSAQQHSQAILLAQDIKERIRANPGAALSPNFAYNNVSLNSSSSPSPVNCVANLCTPAQMAGYDVYQWYGLIVPAAGNKPLLPNASIDISGNDGVNFQVRIQWGDPDGPQSLSESFTTS
jgi:type IV pilus assembly protein PilV